MMDVEMTDDGRTQQTQNHANSDEISIVLL